MSALPSSYRLSGFRKCRYCRGVLNLTRQKVVPMRTAEISLQVVAHSHRQIGLPKLFISLFFSLDCRPKIYL
jgi:hypothetical protein